MKAFRYHFHQGDYFYRDNNISKSHDVSPEIIAKVRSLTNSRVQSRKNSSIAVQSQMQSQEKQQDCFDLNVTSINYNQQQQNLQKGRSYSNHSKNQNSSSKRPITSQLNNNNNNNNKIYDTIFQQDAAADKTEKNEKLEKKEVKASQAEIVFNNFLNNTINVEMDIRKTQEQKVPLYSKSVLRKNDYIKLQNGRSAYTSNGYYSELKPNVRREQSCTPNNSTLINNNNVNHHARNYSLNNSNTIQIQEHVPKNRQMPYSMYFRKQMNSSKNNDDYCREASSLYAKKQLQQKNNQSINNNNNNTSFNNNNNNASTTISQSMNNSVNEMDNLEKLLETINSKEQVKEYLEQSDNQTSNNNTSNYKQNILHDSKTKQVKQLASQQQQQILQPQYQQQKKTSSIDRAKLFQSLNQKPVIQNAIRNRPQTNSKQGHRKNGDLKNASQTLEISYDKNQKTLKQSQQFITIDGSNVDNSNLNNIISRKNDYIHDQEEDCEEENRIQRKSQKQQQQQNHNNNNTSLHQTQNNSNNYNNYNNLQVLPQQQQQQHQYPLQQTHSRNGSYPNVNTSNIHHPPPQKGQAVSSNSAQANSSQNQSQTYNISNDPNSSKPQSNSSFTFKYSFRTKQGVLASNANKPNQDQYIIQTNLCGKSFQHVFGVCDGHGLNGHLASQFVKQNFTHLLQQDKDILTNPKSSLFNACAIINHQLGLSEIDCSFSGTTLVSILLQRDRIFVTNVGDSRAISGRQSSSSNQLQQGPLQKHQQQHQQKTQLQQQINNHNLLQQQSTTPSPSNSSNNNSNCKWVAKDLSRDHKPGLHLEAERILRAGGRIDTFRDQEGNPLGPLRVWMRRENIPGLAMSRSIGDDVATSIGVTWEPEIMEYNIDQDDKFLVVSSDGVWEFIESQDCVNLIAPFYEKRDLEGACDCLLKEAHAKWTVEDDSVVDDITFIIIFLEHQANVSNASNNNNN